MHLVWIQRFNNLDNIICTEFKVDNFWSVGNVILGGIQLSLSTVVPCLLK